MGNVNCCNQRTVTRQIDTENLKFDALDYNKSKSYKQLEEVTAKVSQGMIIFYAEQGIPTCYSDLVSRMIAHRQEHLLRKLSTFTRAEDKMRMLQSLQSIEFELLDSLYYNYFVGERKLRRSDSMDIQIHPFQVEPSHPEFTMNAYKLIASGGVAVCLLMGGSSERYKNIKYISDIGLPSSKSIAQILTERIIRVQKLANCSNKVQIYVVCNEQNQRYIKDFYISHNYFGIDQDLVKFLIQNEIPVVDDQGRLLITDEGIPIQRPGGSGSILSTFLQSHFFSTGTDNIKYVHFIGCENLLALPLEPSLIGMADNQLADVLAVSVPPDHETELPFAIDYGGQIKLLDSSDEDMTIDLLRYSPQVLNDLVVSVSFLKRLNKNKQLQNQLQQKYHLVHRVIDGRHTNIFEKHIQDLLEVADNKIVVGLSRMNTYAPLIMNEHPVRSTQSSTANFKKHLNPQDVENGDFNVSTVTTNSHANHFGDRLCAIQQLSLIHKKWLNLRYESLGSELVEISPLTSYRGENLTQFSHLAQQRLEFPMHVE